MRLFPKRRWLRFSVRTLLVVVTIFCVWLGWQVRLVDQRRQVFEQLAPSEARRRASWVKRLSMHPPRQPKAQLSWWRSQLGDKLYKHVMIVDGKDDRERIIKTFPEAAIETLSAKRYVRMTAAQLERRAEEKSAARRQRLDREFVAAGAWLVAFTIFCSWIGSKAFKALTNGSSAESAPR